jgi:vanillate O-demethylase ferredoxin subunit
MVSTLQLRVRALTWEAEGVLGIELVPPQRGTLLPPFEAGAHVDLHLPGGLVRSYSLLNAAGERTRYCIAVHRAPSSRGGSRWLHDTLRVGDGLTVGTPRNLFALDAQAPLSVLIAGGIGITPLLAMARQLTATGRRWVLHHAARDRAHAAFQDTLHDLARAGAGQVHWHFDDEAGAVLDVAAIVQALPADAHVYCCGPQPMLEAFERATATLPRERVHLEYFGGAGTPATGGGFSLRLRRSGRTVPVAAGQTILAALQGCGIEPLHSCGEGVCGTCEVAVLAGTPDHRDRVLSDAEKATNTRMLICVSGSKTPELDIDL